jgi:hypothetical protein
VTAEDNRWRRCDLKTISLVGNVLMRQLAADAGAIETVMFRDGNLTEASASNVLVVIDAGIVAPPKDSLILPGITYGATYEFAQEAGIPFSIRPVPGPRPLGATRCGCRRRPRRCWPSRRWMGPSAGAGRGRCSGGCGTCSTHKPRRPGWVSALEPWITRAVGGAETPVVEDKPGALAPPAGLDRADEQHVIAGSMPRVVVAFEPGDTARDQRHPAPSR